MLMPQVTPSCFTDTVS